MIELAGVSLKYPDGTLALKDINRIAYSHTLETMLQ
jgi:hypothetical protein